MKFFILCLTLFQLYSVLSQECNPPYYQCGGNGWKGLTCCISGYECKMHNEWFSQCLEASPEVDTNNNNDIDNNNEEDTNDDSKIYKEPIGYASMNGGTTGGQGGKVIVVTNETKLANAAAMKEPIVIIIDGIITLSDDIKISSNKSIIGANENAGVTGAGFDMEHVNNIIIQNIKFSFCLGTSKDCINGAYTTNVWIDHCELFSDLEHGKDYYDGLIDFNHGSDFITVSWCYIHDHNKTSLIGSSDRLGNEDTGKLHITYHHNYFKNLNSRVPSVRFGTLHVFNCVYDGIIQNAINVRMGAQGLIEGCIFIDSRRPISTDLFSSGDGFAVERNNDFGSLGDTVSISQVGTFEKAPYPCTIVNINTLYELVTHNAGLIKRNFKNDYLS
ncbi:pectin lyase-like protein [Neocallimastix lanati (nom. inval.)]|jgi:pectate lyase|nr:pectin lyase-like protein [Neocallimastix sp. JGI-2020a]